MAHQTLTQRLQNYLQAFRPYRLARFQDYERHARTVSPCPKAETAMANVLLADGNVTLAEGREISQTTLKTLRDKVARHTYGLR